jgi:hypothetical protein
MVLNSWKEVAAYLGRGVRTVQRYERDLGLPVRRPRGTRRSAVIIAFTDELDHWLRTAPTGENGAESIPSRSAQVQALTVMDKKIVQDTLGERHDLLRRCSDLRRAHNEAVTKLMMNLNVLVQEINTKSTDPNH